MRSQVLYRAAQVMDLCIAGPEQMTETPSGLRYCQPMPRLHDCRGTNECNTDAPFVLEACGQSVLGSDHLRQEDRRRLASVAGNVQLKVLQGMLRQASQVCVNLLMHWMSDHAMRVSPRSHSVQLKDLGNMQCFEDMTGNIHC